LYFVLNLYINWPLSFYTVVVLTAKGFLDMARVSLLQFSLMLAVFGAAFLLLAQAAQAQDASFTVEGVEVDVTADNAVNAREQAFDAAQIKAYEMLAQRRLPPEQYEGFTTPDLNTISALVKDYEVTNEKLSAVRYVGTYTIRFRPHTLGSASAPGMAGQPGTAAQPGMPGTQTPPAGAYQPAAQPTGAPQILVLPVIQRDGRNYLWSTGPYREAWSTALAHEEGGRFILPQGDAQDRAAIRDDEVLNYDPARFSRMTGRYQVPSAAMVVVNPQAESDGQPAADVRVFRAGPQGPRLVKAMMVPAYAGEMPEELFTRVVAQALMVLKNQPLPQIRTATTPPPENIPDEPVTGPSSTLTAQLNFNSVREWVDFKRAIENASGVSSVMVKSMSARQALVDVRYQGDINSLSSRLRQVNVNLNTPALASSQYGQPQIYRMTRVR
jgi:hypothetical protein